MPRNVDIELPHDSPYSALPEPLRDTLVRSFVDRIRGQERAHDNLMFGFREPLPKTPWEALDHLGPMAVNLLLRLYHRIEGIDKSLTLWREIKWIRNQWWGGSAGIKVEYWNPAAIRDMLDGLLDGRRGNRVARDRFIGTLDHQLSSAFALLPRALDPRAEAPDADTWREVDMPKKPSVHFCVGKSDLPGFERPGPRHVKLDDIHIDWFSPVECVDPKTGRCDYLSVWKGSALHWFQAHFGYDAPTFTFERIDEQVAEGKKLVKKSRVSEESRRRFRNFAERWGEERIRLAVSGLSGYEISLDRFEEMKRIMRALDA